MRTNILKRNSTFAIKRNIVKSKRLENGVSLREMSKRVHMPVWVYWYIENHIRYITIDMIMGLLDVLDIRYTRG